jgi:hypothetical protein
MLLDLIVMGPMPIFMRVLDRVRRHGHHQAPMLHAL